MKNLKFNSQVCFGYKNMKHVKWIIVAIRGQFGKKYTICNKDRGLETAYEHEIKNWIL